MRVEGESGTGRFIAPDGCFEQSTASTANARTDENDQYLDRRFRFSRFRSSIYFLCLDFTSRMGDPPNNREKQSLDG